LYESASGYALFQRLENEEIGQLLDRVQQSVLDLGLFRKMVSLVSFCPFLSSDDALENMNAISEGMLHDRLRSFLEANVGGSTSESKDKKKKKSSKSSVQLGVSDDKLVTAIQDNLGISCVKTPVITEIVRGLRLHFDKLIDGLDRDDLEKAQRGLGHAYSRSKVQFNVNRVDNHIIQSISLLDQLDKDINTFAMRIREWYSWHFPELARIVTDNLIYARLVKAIQDKSNVNEELLEELETITGDEVKAKSIVDASKTSMGTDISEFDMKNVVRFAERVISLGTYRAHLHTYLTDKMHAVAPNLSELIGEQVGARLIAHAGSLTNLAKYPASTVQILGAEKALFRALKTRGKTPKYGLIFHSTFIGRAGTKDKGRISRYLANKCSIASRIDCFADTQTSTFGTMLRDQVEERLEFYSSGKTPEKNIDVMRKAIKIAGVNSAPEELPKLGKRKHEEIEEPKKEKKDKKVKSEDKKEKKDKKKQKSEEPKEDKKKKEKSSESKKDKKSKDKSSEPKAKRQKTA